MYCQVTEEPNSRSNESDWANFSSSEPEPVKATSTEETATTTSNPVDADNTEQWANFGNSEPEPPTIAVKAANSTEPVKSLPKHILDDLFDDSEEEEDTKKPAAEMQVRKIN